MRYSQLPADGPRFLSRCLTALCLALPVAGCLERSNPFDPINQIVTPFIEKIRDQNRAALDTMINAGLSTPQEVKAFYEGYAADTMANVGRRAANQARLDTNTAREKTNAAWKAANDTTLNPDSLRNLVEYLPLNPLVQVGPYPWLESARSRSREAIFRVIERTNTVNAATVPVIVYPQTYIDSLLAPLRRDAAAAETLWIRIDAYNDTVAKANVAIDEYNADITKLNGDVVEYNKGIDFLRETLKKGVIINPDSLVTAVRDAQPGDTILLGRGTLAVDIRDFNSGTQENPIVIRGFPGRQTILKAGGTAEQAGNLDSTQHVRFEDLVFRGGTNSGIKLTHGSRDVIFRRCLFDSNGVRGIDASDSDLKLEDCEIVANGVGIRVVIAVGSDAEIDLKNVLIARNISHGIEAVTPSGRISNATISDNGGNGLHITSPGRTLAVENSILSWNSGYGVFLGATFNNPDGLIVKTCDLWRNRVPEDPDDDWHLENLDSATAAEVRKDNMAVDPVFVDPAALDYGLRPESELLRFETEPPFVVIGYRRKR